MEFDAPCAEVKHPTSLLGRPVLEIESYERQQLAVRGSGVGEGPVVRGRKCRGTVRLIEAEHEGPRGIALIEKRYEFIAPRHEAVDVGADMHVGIEDRGVCGYASKRIYVGLCEKLFGMIEKIGHDGDHSSRGARDGAHSNL